MPQENSPNDLENKSPINPFEGHPLRALNIERMKTEERLDEIKEKMGRVKEGNPAEFEEFKQLNRQKTLIEKSLTLIEEASAKARALEDKDKIEDDVAMRLERDAR